MMHRIRNTKACATLPKVIAGLDPAIHEARPQAEQYV